MRFKFNSLTRQDIGYIFNDESCSTPMYFYSNAGGFINNNIYEYPTYGDGNIQHGSEQLVQNGFFIDAISSLGKYLLDSPEQAEKFFSSIRFNDITSRKEVLFIKSVKHNDKKMQWYSLNLQKKSTSDSKRHDKRFEHVPEFADGTSDSIFRLLVKEYHSLVDRIMLIMDIRDYTDYGSFIDIEKYTGVSQDDWHDHTNCIHIIKNLREQYKAKYRALRSFECLENNWISRQNKISEAA